MLEYAGIPANFVLIRTYEQGKIDTTLPNLHIFNHAILYVPEFDLYLDGTAESSGSNELPYMDTNTVALIVGNEDEPHNLVITPTDSHLKNTATLITEVSTKQDRLIFTTEANYTGQFAPSYRREYQTGTRQNELLEKEITYDWPGAKLIDADFTTIDNLEKPVKIHYAATIPEENIVETTNGEYKFKPLLQSISYFSSFVPTASRTHDLIIPYPLTLNHNLTFNLPEKFKQTIPPEPMKKTLQNPYLKAEINTELNNNIYTVNVTWSILKQRIPKEEYNQFQTLVRDMEKTLNTQIIWKKQ